jgi:hypothetical protein
MGCVVLFPGVVPFHGDRAIDRPDDDTAVLRTEPVTAPPPTPQCRHEERALAYVRSAVLNGCRSEFRRRKASRRQFPEAQGEQVIATGSSSPANVWAFTNDDQAMRWNGRPAAADRAAAVVPARCRRRT